MPGRLKYGQWIQQNLTMDARVAYNSRPQREETLKSIHTVVHPLRIAEQTVRAVCKWTRSVQQDTA